MKNPLIKILFPAVIIFVSIAVFTGTGWLLPFWAGCLLAAALIFRGWDVLHAALLLFMLALEIHLPLFFGLPTVKSLFPLLASTLLLLPFPRRKEALSWIRAGRLGKTSVLIVIVVAAVSTAALVLWANLVTGHHAAAGRLPAAGLEAARQSLRRLPLWSVFVFGVPAFALVNALAEEGIYRGVLQEALGRVFGRETFGAKTFVLLLQASAFAAAHYLGGFPNGADGYAMALLYGLVLGYLRDRTGGMLAPCLAHFAADLAIGYVLVFYA